MDPYFTTLRAGLPLFPDAVAPLVTIGVIVLQMVGGWFLLSSHLRRQRIMIAIVIIFHLYSILLVGYRYPTTALVMLLVLFGSGYKPLPLPLDRRALFGWGLVVLLFITQFIGYVIPGDQKLTLEGNAYGLHMFEAN